MTKLVLLVSFVLFVPSLLIACLVVLLAPSFDQNTGGQAIVVQPPGVAYAALPSFQNAFTEHIESIDARPEIVRQFFEKYNSPLKPHADVIVKLADQYTIDYRLIPAIAMQESGACKKIPLGSHNCWGFGIYGKNVRRFANYEEGITTVTKSLAKEYKAKGYETPREIMAKYTPSSNGSWAAGVEHFMDRLE